MKQNDLVAEVNQNNSPLELNIEEYLRHRYLGKEVIYIPNPGNLGDALISHSTIKLFDKLKLNYKLGSLSGRYYNQNIVYGGGGNLVGTYKNCENFLLGNHQNNNILILPHTIKDVDNILRELGENVTIICRELVSYEYVKGRVRHQHNVMLHRDMALLFDYTPYVGGVGEYHLNCFRIDPEKTSIEIPGDNIDITQACWFPSWPSTALNIGKAASILLKFMTSFESISTNRLHVAIAGTLMQKQVRLYTNSYYKNKAVYDYCLIDYPNICFLE